MPLRADSTEEEIDAHVKVGGKSVLLSSRWLGGSGDGGGHAFARGRCQCHAGAGGSALSSGRGMQMLRRLQIWVSP